MTFSLHPISIYFRVLAGPLASLVRHKTSTHFIGGKKFKGGRLAQVNSLGFKYSVLSAVIFLHLSLIPFIVVLKNLLGLHLV